TGPARAPPAPGRFVPDRQARRGPSARGSRGARTDPPAGSRHRRILGAGRGPRPAGSPTVGFEAQEKTLDVVAPRAPGLLELQVGRPRALGQAIPAGSPG